MATVFDETQCSDKNEDDDDDDCGGPSS